MKLVAFGELLQRIEADGLTESVIADLEVNGAEDDSGHPLSSATTSLTLLGFRITKTGDKWSIANV